MARYRGGDGHYADVECAYAELKRHFVLNALRPPGTTLNSMRSSFGSVASHAPPAPQPPCVEVTGAVKFLIGRCP
jgi:hypothetical protein